MTIETPGDKTRKAEYMREYRRKYYGTPEGKARKANEKRKSKYGLTPEQHAAMLETQGGLCAICRGKGNRHGLVVDHCHETGALRGLLCFDCNVAIGKLGDTPAGVMRAVKYLRDARKRQQLPLLEGDE